MLPEALISSPPAGQVNPGESPTLATGFLRRISALALPWVLLALLAGAAPGDAAGDPWRAQWIGVAAPDAPNRWIAFRKEFRLEEPPRTAIARIAVDSKYWLWVNGHLVVFEGQLKRGPTPRDTYYDAVSLAPYLRAGENTIALLVWYWGKDGFSHHDSGRAGLLFDASLDGEPLLSDSGWKARIHPAFGSTPPPHPNFRLPEHNIQFDARRDLTGWSQPGYDDNGWPTARELGTPPTAPWNALLPRPIPLWKNSGLQSYVNSAELPTESTGDTVVARLPYNAQITPYLEIDAPAGLELHVLTDNYIDGGAETVRGVYITRDGVQKYESLGWMNGHDVRYVIPKGVKILSLRYRETGYGAEMIGSFEADDPALNSLWQKAQRTLYVTMRDTYMDTPGRERAQWWGDEVNELGEAFYVFDPVAGPRLARKGIYELVRWQRADGSLYSPVPAGIPAVRSTLKSPTPSDGSWDRELPLQMLASVGWYGFWTYYWYTGDRQTISDAYPAVREYLRLWRLDENGLVVHRPGEWDWGDWGENIDMAVLENAWYYLALKGAAEMAVLTGHERDAPEYRSRMRRIRSAFERTFWTGDRYRSPGYSGTTDDRANAMAVVAGLARTENYPALRRVLREEEHASPYMEKYVLEALFQMDAPDEAMQRMKGRYAKQIESPITTLWEGWGLGAEGYGGGTYNHAWSGGPLTLLSQYGAGIAPTRPGWASYSVLPRMGSLRKIDAIVPTPRGNIRVELRREDAEFRMRLHAPAGADGVAGVPNGAGEVRRITVNGAEVWRDGKAVSSGLAVRVVGVDERWIRISVPPGEWTISAETPAPTGEECQKEGGTSTRLCAPAESATGEAMTT